MTSGAPPDTLRVRTADNLSLGYAVAGLGSRMVAQLLDNLLAGVIVLVALLGYSALAGTATTAQGAGWVIGGAVAFAFFVYFGYFFIAEAVSGGRTPGKSALGLRVIRVDGSAADVSALAVRNIVRLLDVTGIGAVVMFFHPLSRRLGDLAGGTVVVRESSAAALPVPAPPPLIVRTPDAGPAVDGIDRLGSREHDALRAFLSRTGLGPEIRHRLASDMAARLCDRMQLPPAAPERHWPPELLLERLYLQLDQRRR